MKKFRSIVRTLQEHMKRDKKAFAIYVIIRSIVILVMIRAIFRQEYESVFICALSLVLLLMPALIERSLKIDFPTNLEVVIMVFIFAAEMLGEISEYYVKYPNWDTILHVTNGFLCAAIGFALVDVLNRSERVSLKLTPLYVAIAAFCFSMTIGVLWEFFEFSVDCLFNMDMQKDTVLSSIYSVSLNPTGANKVVALEGIEEVFVNGQPLGVGGYLDIGLYDTMEDLFVNFIGATVFSVFGFFYSKNKGKGGFFKSFIPVVVDNFDDEDITDEPGDETIISPEIANDSSAPAKRVTKYDSSRKNK